MTKARSDRMATVLAISASTFVTSLPDEKRRMTAMKEMRQLRDRPGSDGILRVHIFSRLGTVWRTDVVVDMNLGE
jgi:hypothetical protein